MRIDDRTRRKRLMAAMLFVVFSTTGYALLLNWSALARTGSALLIH